MILGVVMDKPILLMTAGIIPEIIIIAIFLKKFQDKTFLKVKILVVMLFGIMVPLQILTIISMLVMAGVFEPYSQFTENSSIQNPSSQALIPLIKKEDFPENWEWISETLQQPGEIPWKDSPSDTATSVIIAKVPHLLIFRHYVRVFNWSAFYDLPMSEKDFNNRISRGGKDETSFIPKVNKAGKYFYAICGKGSDYYSCDVFIGYEHSISYLIIITPQEFGEKFTIDLINLSVESIEKRVK